MRSIVGPPAYFDRAHDLYLTHEEWRKAWQQALRVSYKPICDVPVIGSRGEVRKGLVEVAKYCVKPADWITFKGGPAAKWQAEPQIVRELAAGLRSKRLIGWGGVLRAVHDARGLWRYRELRFRRDRLERPAPRLGDRSARSVQFSGTPRRRAGGVSIALGAQLTTFLVLPLSGAAFDNNNKLKCLRRRIC